jgi:iron complex outermembrane receptor protein
MTTRLLSEPGDRARTASRQKSRRSSLCIRSSYPAGALFACLALLKAGRAECIRVVVQDPAGLPIANATVKPANGASSRTGAVGAAELCGLARGPHVLTVEAPDFAPASLTADAPGERTVKLALLPRVESPVVVTGAPEPRQLAEVDRSIAVIPVENPLAPGVSLTDMLKMDSSVDVRERGPDGTQADVEIRGGRFSQTLVLIDGIRVNDAQSGHHNMDLPLPMESISRMEVLHGSGSTLYGSDAVAGALNVITRRPEAGELTLYSGAGDFGWNREAASGGFRLGRWSQSLGVARDFSTGFRTDRDYRNLAAAAESFVDEPFGSTVVLFGYNDRPFGAGGFYGPYPSWEKTGTKLLAVHQTAGDHHVQFSYRRHHDQYVLYRDQPAIFQNLHSGGSWDGSYAYHRTITPAASLTGGVEALSESIASTNLGNHRRERASAFFVVEARLTARLTLTAGLREEAYRTWRGVTSPTAAAGFRLGKGFKARGSVGHAFRMPTYTDLYYHDPSNLGNPNLRPESAWNYEGGLDWWSRGGTSLAATWFERRERNTIDFVRPAGASIWQALNYQRLNFHGGEIAWRQRVRRAEIGAGYTILRASRQLTPGFASRYVFNFPRSSAVVSARFPMGRWATARTRFGAFNRSWQPTTALWDIALAGQAGRIEPFIQVSNALNTYYEAFPGLPEPGRWIRGGVQLHLFGRR